MARALAEGSDPPATWPRRRSVELVDPFVLRQRKRARPLVMPVSAELRGAVEERLFEAACRAVTDAVSKLAGPIPAQAITRACVSVGLSPNMVVALCFGVSVLAALSFHGGWLWLGLAFAWLAALLGLVKETLPRVTLNFSQVGAALGHAVDVAAPPLWWWAWWVGCGAPDLLPMAVILAATALTLAEEWGFRWRFGFELHLWRRFDSLFRLVAAQRNTLLVILTAGLALGRPLAGFAVAAGWSAFCAVLQGARLAQAFRAARSGAPPMSWLKD